MVDRARVAAFLTRAQASGEIRQQEEASMLPALALRPIESHHFVLDLCSAPGSKTLQLLDAMSCNRPSAGAHPSTSLATAYNATRAPKRCWMFTKTQARAGAAESGRTAAAPPRAQAAVHPHAHTHTHPRAHLRG